MLIWRVTYTWVFESFSGGYSYAIRHENEKALVMTRGDRLSDVLDAIQVALDNQSRVIEIAAAEFIGRTLNSLE